MKTKQRQIKSFQVCHVNLRNVKSKVEVQFKFDCVQVCVTKLHGLMWLYSVLAHEVSLILHR